MDSEKQHQHSLQQDAQQPGQVGAVAPEDRTAAGQQAQRGQGMAKLGHQVKQNCSRPMGSISGYGGRILPALCFLWCP